MMCRSVTVELVDWLARHATEFRDNTLGRIPAARAAAQAGDFLAVRTFGHNLKGLGGTFGMDNVSQLGRRLEQEAIAGRGAELIGALDELTLVLTHIQFVPLPA
jgi:hypothetical protein